MDSGPYDWFNGQFRITLPTIVSMHMSYTWLVKFVHHKELQRSVGMYFSYLTRSVNRAFKIFSFRGSQNIHGRKKLKSVPGLSDKCTIFLLSIWANDRKHTQPNIPGVATQIIWVNPVPIPNTESVPPIMGPHNPLLLLLSSLLKLICPGLSIALRLDSGLWTMKTGTPATPQLQLF